MNSMKRLLFTFIIVLSALAGNAKSMKELWAAIPDSLVPSVDKNHRLEMTDFIGMGLKGDVDNTMGGKSVMDTLNDNFIQVKLSEASSMQIKRLPVAGADSILCVVQTWNAPEGESSIAFYNENWQRLDNRLGKESLVDYKSQLIARPDTMSETNYEKLLENIDFTMVKATLSPSTNNITLSLSVPIEDKKKAKEFNSVLLPKTLSWSEGRYL